MFVRPSGSYPVHQRQIGLLLHLRRRVDGTPDHAKAVSCQPLPLKARIDMLSTGIRTENALLSAYIFVDLRDRDIGSYVADAKAAVAKQVVFPSG